MELITEKILTREKDSGTFNTLQSFLDDTKLAYEPPMTVAGSNETIKQAVISNLGIAMISEHCCYNEIKNNLLCKLNVDGLPIIKKWYASEEEKDFVFLNKNGSFSICVDPLDGSSNIETNAPIGTIFGIYKSKKNPNETILQSGDNLIASGFFIYGPRVKLIFSVGNGTSIFQLSQTDEFVLVQEAIKIPENTNELSINFSNYAFWPSYIKSYVEKCICLYEFNNQSNYNMRWIGSLVADCYRILARGGVFLYPQDTRKGYERGRLRLVYEANPVAFIIEQSGAFATDGEKRILSLKPKSIHERVPFIFGSKNEKKKLLVFWFRRFIISVIERTLLISGCSLR